MNKKSWSDVFKGWGWNYRWYCNHGNSYALNLPGYRVQSYFAEYGELVRSRYLVNVYVGKEHIMQEILYRASNSGDYAPISPKAFHNLFPKISFLEIKDTYGFGNVWWKYLEIVEVDEGNRILFKFKKKDWQELVWGVNLDEIYTTFVGLLLSRFGPAIALSCRYPNTIRDLDDSATVVYAIYSLSKINYKRNGYYENQIEDLRGRIKEKTKSIEEFNAQFDKICHSSADALNMLFEKFGIVVNV